MYATFVQVTILQNFYKHGHSAILQNTPSAFTLTVMPNGPLQLRI